MKKPIHQIHNTFWVFILVCLYVTHSCAQYDTTNAREVLPYSTPEAEGVSSAGIIKFLDAVDEGENELHSFVILRHGKIISEGWWSPYAKNLMHVMYSFSKSFTSMGVGLAIADHKLKLTDKVAAFFPSPFLIR